MGRGDPVSAQYINMNEVQVEPVDWLWRNQIQFGELTMVVGDPDAGKSMLTCCLMAHVTTGKPMYDCSGLPKEDHVVGPDKLAPTWTLEEMAARSRRRIIPRRKPKLLEGERVLLYASEDRLQKIQGRLIAAGADLSLVQAMKNDTSERILIPSDIPEIEKELTKTDVRLLIIDPILSFMEGNPSSYTSVKEAMDPLAAMARRTGAAVVLIHHLNKSGRGSALHRMVGSVAIMGSVRSAFLAAKLPRTNRCVLAPIRNKEIAKSLEYRIVGRGHHAVVEWVGESTLTADDLANWKAPEGGPALEEAKRVLFVVLANGKVPAMDAKKAAKEAGVSESTLRRAREALGVVPQHDNTFGPGSRWYWELNEENPDVIRFRNEAPIT